MLKESYELNPLDIVVQKLYYYSIGKKFVMQHDFESKIESMFSNNTIVENYFKELLLYDINS